MKKFDFKKIAMKVVGVGGGAVAADLLNKPMANMNPLIRGGIKVVAGAVLPELMPKQPILEHVGCGIIASGAIDISQKFLGGAAAEAATSGIEDDQFSEEQYVVDQDVNGLEDYETLSGTDEDPIYGAEDDEEVFVE